jgi:Ca2+-binding EF-hand superfamily protein
MTKVDLVDLMNITAPRVVAKDSNAPMTKVDLDGKAGAQVMTRVDLAAVAEGGTAAKPATKLPTGAVPKTKLDLVPHEASKARGKTANGETTPGSASTTTTTSGRLWATHNSNPQRTECARQLGLEIQAKAAKFREEATDISKTFDAQKTGTIPCSRLDQVLSTTRGKKPCEEELNLLLEGFSQQDIPVDKLLELMRAWEIYEVFKDDIDLLFYLYDGDSSGQLDMADVAHVIKELSGGRLSNTEVEAILKKLKLNDKPSTSRREFAMAVAKWQAITPQQRKVNKPASKQELDWSCSIQ